MKSTEELTKEIFANDSDLRRMALAYIIQNIEPHGNRKTLRTLQACFIAGYHRGRLMSKQEWEQAEFMLAHSSLHDPSMWILFCAASFSVGFFVNSLLYLQGERWRNWTSRKRFTQRWPDLCGTFTLGN